MSDYDEDETETSGGDHELHELVFATALGVDLEEEYAAELVDLAVEALYVLPDGWEVRFIESEMGKLPYFFDTETKRKYWTHPFIEDLKNLIVEKRIELADDQGSYVTLDSLASSQVKEQNLERMREKKSPRLRISPRISPRAGTLDQSIKQIVEENKLKDTGIESASKSITSTPKISPRVISLSEKSKKGLPRSQKSSPKDSKMSTPEKQASAKKESAAVSPSPRASNKATPEKPSSTKKESVEISSSPKASEKSTPEKKSSTKEEKSEISPTEEVKSLVAAQISSTPPKSESISVVNEEKEDIPAVSEESKQDSPKLKQESPTPLPESTKFQSSEEEKHLAEPQPIAVMSSEVQVTEALVEDNKLSDDSPVIEVAVVAPPDSAIDTEDKVTDLEGNSIASIHSEGKDGINAAVDSLDAKEKLSEVEIQAEKDLIQGAAANSLNTEEKLSEVEIQTELKEEEEKMVTESSIENEVAVIKEIETVESLHDKVLSPEKSDEKIETETLEAERKQEPLPSDQLEIHSESESLTKTEAEPEVQLEEAGSASELTTISDPAIYTLIGTSIIENILLEAKVKAEQFLMNRLREEAEKEKQTIRRGVSELIEEILQIFEEQEKAEKQRRRTEISGMIETMLASVESKLVKDIVEEREALERARIAAEEQAKEDEKLAEISDHEPLPDSEAVEDILNESHESLRSIHTLAPEKEAELAMLEEIRSIHEEQGEDNQSLAILLSPSAEVAKEPFKSSTPTPTSLGSHASQTPSLISKRSPFAAIILEETEAPDLQPKSLFKDEFPDFFKVETSMIEALDQHPRKKNGPRKQSNVSGSSISTVTTKSSSSQKKSQAVPSYFSATSASDQKKVLKKQTSANGGLKAFSSKSRHPEHDGEYYEDEEDDEEQETLDIDQISKLDQKPKVDPFAQTVDKESEPIFTGTADSVMESSLASLEDDQIPPLEEEDGDITARISDLLNDDRFPQLPPVSLDKSKDITEHFKQMFPTVVSDEKSLKSQKSFTSKRSALKSKMRREVSDLSVGSSLSGPRDAKNITPSPAGHMKMMRKVSIISREFAIDHLDQELAVPEQIIETAPSTAPSSSSITKKKKRRPKSPTTITGVTGWITIEAYNHYKDAERAIEILESFYPVQPLNKDVISCSSKLFPNLQELTNQQSFHPSPSKGNTFTASSSLSHSLMESGNHHNQNLPLLQNHPHNISPPSSSQQNKQQQIPQAEVLNKLKAFETLQKTSKTIQINLEKELPKLRITRDFSKMQWIIECNDKSVKRLFQQRLHKKWPINGATSTMNSASPMKRPPQQQTNFDSTTGSAFSPNRMEDSVDLLKTSMSSKNNNNNNNHGNTSNSSLTEGFMTTNTSNNAYQGEYKASFTLQSFMTSSNSKHVSSVVPVTYHIPKAQLNRLKELPLSSSPNRLNHLSSDHHRRHGGGMRLTSAGKLSMLNAQVQSMASLQHLQTLDPTISYNTPLAFLTKANSFQESNDISNNQSFSSLIFARPKSLN